MIHLQVRSKKFTKLHNYKITKLKIKSYRILYFTFYKILTDFLVKKKCNYKVNYNEKEARAKQKQKQNTARKANK